MWFLPSSSPQREEEREWRVLPVKFYELEVKGLYITSTFPWPEFNCMAMLTAKKSGKCSPFQERREKDLASVMKFSCSHTSPELSPSNLLVIREKRLYPPCLRLLRILVTVCQVKSYLTPKITNIVVHFKYLHVEN